MWRIVWVVSGVGLGCPEDKFGSGREGLLCSQGMKLGIPFLVGAEAYRNVAHM